MLPMLPHATCIASPLELLKSHHLVACSVVLAAPMLTDFFYGAGWMVQCATSVVRAFVRGGHPGGGGGHIRM